MHNYCQNQNSLLLGKDEGLRCAREFFNERKEKLRRGVKKKYKKVHEFSP